MYRRDLNLPNLLKKKSFFLFGPRSTGKTTLVKQQLPNAIVFDLLKSDTYLKLVKNPSLIEEILQNEDQYIVIDEIQKLPALLDEVHRLIENRGLRFLLTGSSARKLKHGGANLLAGRAWQAQLFTLTYHEISDFNLLKYLNRGGLPQVYTGDEYKEELDNYVSMYIQEEIKAEAVTRNVQSFVEFLDVIALSNGEELNYQNLSSDCQVSADTLRNYVQILEDTMIGFRLPGFKKTKLRKPIIRAKHYLFDIGVTNNLAKVGSIQNKSHAYGKAFEHFIILEVRSYNSYRRKKMELCYWRSTTKFEVDLTVGEAIAIEIKSTQLATDKHLKGLRALKEENIFKRYILVSHDENKRITKDKIEIYPWQMFLDELWGGDFF